jgi:hypothetical protein
MSGRVHAFVNKIMPPRHDAPFADQDASDGHLAKRQRCSRLVEGSLHEIAVAVQRGRSDAPMPPASLRRSREQQEEPRDEGAHHDFFGKKV